MRFSQTKPDSNYFRRRFLADLFLTWINQRILEMDLLELVERVARILYTCVIVNLWIKGEFLLRESYEKAMWTERWKYLGVGNIS